MAAPLSVDDWQGGIGVYQLCVKACRVRGYRLLLCLEKEVLTKHRAIYYNVVRPNFSLDGRPSVP